MSSHQILMKVSNIVGADNSHLNVDNAVLKSKLLQIEKSSDRTSLVKLNCKLLKKITSVELGKGFHAYLPNIDLDYLFAPFL